MVERGLHKATVTGSNPVAATHMLKPTITFNQFNELDLRIGHIQKAERLGGSEKLLKLTVDIGEDKPVTILAGLAMFNQPEELADKEIVVIANLEPKTMVGETSQGMLLAADIQGRPVLLAPVESVPAGAPIR